MKKWLWRGGIARWDEGIPLGNGLLGNLIYGTETLIFSLDRADLWDLRLPQEYSSPDFHYEKMLSLMRSGKKEDWDACMQTFNGCYSHATPSKINAGSLVFCLPSAEHLQFSLQMQDGVACVSGNGWEVETFLSLSRKIGVARINGKLTYQLSFPNYYQEILGYSARREEMIGDVFFAYHARDDGGVFGIALRETNEGDGQELRYYVCNSPTLAAAREEVRAQFQAADAPYSLLYREQKREWRKYWAESKIRLPDQKLQDLYEKSYYLFGSGNRQGGYPMPLQGLWTACDGKLPPWKGDYHHDLNTQFTYMSYLRANHLAAGSTFLDYLWKGKATYEAFAKEFYGVEGLLVPAVETLARQPLGGWPMYSLSPTMSIWLAKSFVDYYDFTGDEAFLIERAYPFLEGVASAIAGLLKEKNGVYYLPLCSTPEYGDCTRDACFFDEWTNNDLQLVRYLFETQKRLSALLQKDGEKYGEILKKLPPILVDEKGILKLSERKYYTQSHRHLSHLMCVFPLSTLVCNTEENVAIVKRNVLDLEEKGTGLWVGFSFPWFAQICAVCGFANRALNALQTFEKCFVGENGFHLNGDFKEYGVSVWHYRPFTLEANFAYCEGIRTLLLQDEKGYLELFPCIPEEWAGKTISFEKFRSKNGLLVSAKYEKGNLTALRLLSPSAQTVKMKNEYLAKQLNWSNGQISVEKDGYFYVSVDEKEISLTQGVRRKGVLSNKQKMILED